MQFEDVHEYVKEFEALLSFLKVGISKLDGNLSEYELYKQIFELKWIFEDLSSVNTRLQKSLQPSIIIDDDYEIIKHSSGELLCHDDAWMINATHNRAIWSLDPDNRRSAIIQQDGSMLLFDTINVNLDFTRLSRNYKYTKRRKDIITHTELPENILDQCLVEHVLPINVEGSIMTMRQAGRDWIALGSVKNRLKNEII